MLQVRLRSYFKSFLIALFSLVMVACSGDDSTTDSGGTGGTDNFNLSVTLLDSNNNATTNTELGETYRLRVTLTNNGTAVAGQVINFIVNGENIATISEQSVATNSEGVAEITVVGGTNSGSGYFTISTQESLDGLSDLNLAFTNTGEGSSSADNFAFTAQLLDDSSNASNTLSSSTSLTLRVSLTNNGAPVIGSIVLFSVSDGNFANLSGTTVATNENGVASITVTGGDEAGNGTFTVRLQENLTGVSAINLPFVSEGQVAGNTDNNYEVYLIPDSTTYGEYADISESTVTMVSDASVAKILVKLSKSDNTPIENHLVSFDFSEADGLVSNASESNENGKVLTDENGFAVLELKVGTVSGVVKVGVLFEDGKEESLKFTVQGSQVVEDNYAFTVSLTNDQDIASSTLSSATTLTLTASLTNNGDPVVGRIVNFSVSDSAFASLSGTTVATDTSGEAQIVVSGGLQAGSGTFTVSLQESLPGVGDINLPFVSEGEVVGNLDNQYEAYLIPLATASDAYAGVTASSISTISQASPAKILVKLKDSNSAPIANQIVTFDLTGAQGLVTNASVANQNGRVLTDENGFAVLELAVGTVSGVGEILVTFSDGKELTLVFSSAGDAQAGSASYNYQAFLVPSSTAYEDYDDLTVSTLTTISASQPGTVVVRLSDVEGNPVPVSLVTIRLADEAANFASLSSESGTALTDVAGFAAIDIIASDVAGAGYIEVEFFDGKIEQLPFESKGDGNQEPPVEIGSIELLVSSVQLASSGSDEVELLALIKDAQNNLMEGVTVEFSSDSGAIEVVQATTLATGIATAKLSTKGNPETRAINVSAFVGGDSADIAVTVAGTSIKITGNSSVVTGDAVEMTAVMLDSDGNGIPLRNIEIISSAGNTLTDTNGDSLPTNDSSNEYITTDSTGVAIFRYVADNSGQDTLSASALGESGELAISVSPDSFVISDLEVAGNAVLGTDVPLSGGNLTLTWEKDSAPHVGGEVLFSLTRGQATSVDCADDVTASSVTDGNGQLCVNVNANEAGPAILTATADGISASFEFEFVAERAHQIDLQASPFSIGPNGQKATIVAVVRDKDGNLVKNRPVNFSLFDVTGGEIFPASDITDSNGLATTVFTSNNVSALEGVTIGACTDLEGATSSCQVSHDSQDDDDRRNDTYGCTPVGPAGDDFGCVADGVQLTVADREAFITLGTGNVIGSASDELYEKVYNVSVTDVDSLPIENAELVVSAIPVAYYEGDWAVVLNDDGDFDHYAPNYRGVCLNEDIDRDTVLDFIEDVDGDGIFSTVNEDLDNDGYLDKGEDVNHNGILDTGEDRNGNGLLDLTEDLNGDGTLDVDEDVDNDGHLDFEEDIDGDGQLDLFYEYVGGVCSLEDASNVDLNNDGTLDVGEDINCNRVLDEGEDIDGDGLLDLTEDLDSGNRVGDIVGGQTYRSGDVDGHPGEDNPDFSTLAIGDGRLDDNEDVDGDGNLDRFNEDIDGDGHFDQINEDVNGDNELDVIEIDHNNNGIADSDGINEDRNRNGTLEPGNIVTVVGDLVTDEFGQAQIRLRYPESYGAWVKVHLVVKTKVSGTEYTRDVEVILPFSAEDTTNETNPPTQNLFGSDGNCATVK